MAETTHLPMTGVRSTKQRSAISSLLDDTDEFRSAQDLHEELRRRGQGIGLTTVYRTLQALVDAGTVDVLRTDNGESVYRRCSSGHHHHLVCRHCGATVEVEGPAVDAGPRPSPPSTGSPTSVIPSRCSAPANPALQPTAVCSSVRAWDAEDSTSISIVPSASASNPAPGNA